MKYTVEFFNGIDSCDDIKNIRTEIFIDEQHFKNEFDDTDKIATHLIVYDNGVPIATGRTFPKEAGSTTYMIGRIAVIKSYRKMSIGSLVVSELEEFAKKNGAEITELSAQVRVKEFYRQLGYKETGNEYLDEYCPHILMRKKLEMEVI